MDPQALALVSLEDMIESFYGANLNWPPLLRMTVVASLLWITWKTRNRLVFDMVVRA
jgi:hypothetical protein